MDKLAVLDIAKGERENEKRDIEYLRTISDRERGAMIAACCRAAAKIEEGRAKSGMPPVPPSTWPASTWELLRKLATDAERS